MGTRISLLTDVNLGESDASYFQVPEGYKVVKRQAGMFSGYVLTASQRERVSSPETTSNER
jgi:hypothetical protein